MRTQSEQRSWTRETDHDPNRKKKKKKKKKKKNDDNEENDDAEEEVADRVESQTGEVYSPKKKKKTKDRMKNKNAEMTMVDEAGELNSSPVESLNLGSDRSAKGKMSEGRNETEGKRKKGKNAVGSDLETGSEITHDGKVNERSKVKEKGGDGKGRRKDEKSRSGEFAESAPEEDAVTDLVSDENSSGALGKKKNKKERNGVLEDNADVGRLDKKTKKSAKDASYEGTGSKKESSFDSVHDAASSKNKKKVKHDDNGVMSSKGRDGGIADDGAESKKKRNGNAKEDLADDGAESKKKRNGNAKEDLDNGVSSKKRKKVNAKDDTDNAVSRKGKMKKRKEDVNTDADDARPRKKRRKGNVEGDVDGVSSKRKRTAHGKDVDGGAKKTSTGIADGSKNDRAANQSRKVRFSDEVEVFQLPKGGKHPLKAHGDSLVQGKRFTPEEDEMVKDAVLNYIKVHNLGENGVDIMMNSARRRELRGCWKEIGTYLPWRPYTAVYYRAHILFEGDGKHKWDSEEYELLRRHHAKHGSDWKKLAVQLGKHRFHIKDAWRRIKLPNKKSGHWSQDEYENLFDLVNKDLCIRAHQEKITKHGMLRDNIGWEAISEKLTTRTNMTCCKKWYEQLASPMVIEGLWNNSDDYRLLQALTESDATCLADVDWDSLLEHRSGDICLKRWKEMTKYIGGYKEKAFVEQVEVLSSRYCSDMIKAVEAYESK